MLEIAENRSFENLTRIWLAGDHHNRANRQEGTLLRPPEPKAARSNRALPKSPCSLLDHNKPLIPKGAFSAAEMLNKG